jgi:hypothetical protein
MPALRALRCIAAPERYARKVSYTIGYPKVPDTRCRTRIFGKKRSGSRFYYVLQAQKLFILSSKTRSLVAFPRSRVVSPKGGTYTGSTPDTQKKLILFAESLPLQHKELKMKKAIRIPVAALLLATCSSPPVLADGPNPVRLCYRKLCLMK